MPRWAARSSCAPAAAPRRRCSSAPAPRLRYDAQGRRLILPFKHADRTELAAVLAPHMARAGAVLLREADLLVPVPLHRVAAVPAPLQPGGAAGDRRWGGSPGGRALPDALVRRRATASLGEKSAAERAAEVAGAFAVRPSRAAQRERASGCCWSMM